MYLDSLSFFLSEELCLTLNSATPQPTTELCLTLNLGYASPYQ
jgi:hypothetical protein